MQNSGVSVFLIIVAVLMGFVSYPFLPNDIAMHFNGSGNPSSFVPKWFGLVLVPLVMTFLHMYRKTFKPEMIYVKGWRMVFYLIQLVLVGVQGYIIYFGLFR